MKSIISSENHRFSEEGITVIDGLADENRKFFNDGFIFVCRLQWV